MRILDLTAASGSPMTAFDTIGTHVAPFATTGQASLTCMRLDAGARIGRHDAGPPLLFVPTTGEVRVTGADGAIATITAGQAVLWDAGEAHDLVTTTGCIILAIEAPLSLMG